MALIKDLAVSESQTNSYILQPRLKHKYRVCVNSEALTADEQDRLQFQTISIDTSVTTNPMACLLEDKRWGLHYTQEWVLETEISNKLDKAVFKLFERDVTFDMTVEQLDGDATVLFSTKYTGCNVSEIKSGLNYSVSEACRYTVTFETLNAENDYEPSNKKS